MRQTLENTSLVIYLWLEDLSRGLLTLMCAHTVYVHTLTGYEYGCHVCDLDDPSWASNLVSSIIVCPEAYPDGPDGF